MKKVLDKIANLIEVRKIVTLIFALSFVYLSVTLKLMPSETLPIFTMIFGYYFGKSTSEDGRKGD